MKRKRKLQLRAQSTELIARKLRREIWADSQAGQAGGVGGAGDTLLSIYAKKCVHIYILIWSPVYGAEHEHRRACIYL